MVQCDLAWPNFYFLLLSILIEMVTGLPPFYSENTNLMYKKILHNTLLFPPGFCPKASSLICGLLDRNPLRRLGGGLDDAKPILSHVFFEGLDWDQMSRKLITPPFKPSVVSQMSPYSIHFPSLDEKMNFYFSPGRKSILVS